MRCPSWFDFGVTLDYRNIDSGRALLPFLNVKGNPIAFIQGFESGTVDSGMMYEYIRTIFLLDEAITFPIVKPFHNTIRHSDTVG